MIEPEVQQWLSYEAETERLRAETDRLRGIVQRYENAEAEVMREVELPPHRATDTDQREQLMAEAALTEQAIREIMNLREELEARSRMLRQDGDN